MSAPPSPHASQDMLRAMAHPLRLQIMQKVSRLGTARAADIAADMGIPANSVSYHLRILHRGGVIEEAPEKARDRRDRVWRLTDRASAAGRDGDLNDPATGDGGAAALAVSFAALEGMRAAWAREVSRAREDGPVEPGVGRMSTTTLRLSTEQAQQLNDRIDQLLHEYDALNHDEQGVAIPGDPDSAGTAQDFQVLFALVREAPPTEAAPGAP